MLESQCLNRIELNASELASQIDKNVLDVIRCAMKTSHCTLLHFFLLLKYDDNLMCNQRVIRSYITYGILLHINYHHISYANRYAFMCNKMFSCNILLHIIPYLFAIEI